MKHLIWLFLLFFLCSGSALYSSQDGINPYIIMTESFIPFSYEQEGLISGCATDIVREMLMRLERKEGIGMINFNLIRKEKRLILFSMEKTEEMISNYQWLGPLISPQFVMISKTRSSAETNQPVSNQISVNQMTMTNEPVIGLVEKTESIDILTNENISNLRFFDSEEEVLQALNEERIDLWFSDDYTVRFYIEKSPNPIENYRIERKLGIKDFYMVFSKDIPEEEFILWQSVFKQMNTDGSYMKIISRYRMPENTISEQK